MLADGGRVLLACNAMTMTRLHPLVRPLLLAAVLAAPAGTAASAAPAVVLPDTGLFAPVAAQLAAREKRLASPSVGALERIHLLITSGRAADAAGAAARLPGDDTATRIARARAALAVQDFAAAGPLVARLAPFTDPATRRVRYAWEFVRDAAGAVDSLSRAALAGPGAAAPDWLAAGRLAYDMLDYARADSLFGGALAAAAGDGAGAEAASWRSAAHVGRAVVLQKRQKWDASLAEIERALAASATPEALDVLSNTLIRLGRTGDAISAAEWGVRLNPYHDASHYMLGNGYARKNYTQLVAAYPASFGAGPKGARALAAADAVLAAGRRVAARTAYRRLIAAHPGWVDARVRLASLDFEEGRFAQARDGCFAALRACPEYGRAHAVLAKALESQRFAADVHRADYERRFAARPTPRVTGIERFVANWNSLTPRHQKRVALSIEPWKAFVPLFGWTPESGWAAVRCIAKGTDGRIRFAHTAPWWVEIEGKPLRPRREQADWFVQRTEEEIARNTGVLSAEQLAEFHEALAAWKKIQATAK